ncbi:MAG: signal transduction histidine kinase [Gammaproteobacteria bacterium]|jgi:signal transduction histidine kinase
MNLSRLRLFVISFMTALMVPSVVLVMQAYDQLKWEAIHQHQQLARELVLRMDAGFQSIVKREERRAFSDYSFLNVEGSGGNTFLQRSPLSIYPPRSDIPGLVGYFQINPDGQLRSPAVPDSQDKTPGIDAAELGLRLAQESYLRAILSANRLNVHDAPVAEETAEEAEFETATATITEFDQALASAALVAKEAPEIENYQYMFDDLKSVLKDDEQYPDQLSRKQLSDLKLENSYQISSTTQKSSIVGSREKKSKRKELTSLAESLESNQRGQPSPRVGLSASDIESLSSNINRIRIRTFESEIGLMQFRQLENGYFALFRDAWRNQQRFVQGFLLSPDAVIDRLLLPVFQESALSPVARLDIIVGDGLIKTVQPDRSNRYVSTASTTNELLYQTRLLAPFDGIEIIFSLEELPLVIGGNIILWSALLLTLVIFGGSYLLYRLGVRQIDLTHQQQNFISAVSHELKTPLTSIRMYGEILREGWADEERKKSYYDFIFNESERLSRLINNILQLARLSRNEQKGNFELSACVEIGQSLHTLLESQVRTADFQLEFEDSSLRPEDQISIDRDWLSQVVINLADNAIKFSARAEIRKIKVSLVNESGRLSIRVRDFGPGIPKDQMTKIFKLFYRSEHELTRETMGTGIGLSLVRQLVDGMNGKIDVVNMNPGACFEVSFPLYRGQ